MQRSWKAVIRQRWDKPIKHLNIKQSEWRDYKPFCWQRLSENKAHDIASKQDKNTFVDKS